MARLNRALLEKIAAKTNKSVQYVREQISKRATRRGILSEAELIRWARELKIGSGLALRALSPHAQPQARTETRARTGGRGKSPVDDESQGTAPDPIVAAIPVLLMDEELRSRCADLLRRPRNFDRAVASATTVLEARVRTRSGIKGVTAAPLMTRALNPDPAKAVLVVSETKSEQEGFFNLCHGVTLWFRNRTHHHLDAELTRGDALRICAFIDLLLPIVDGASVRAAADPQPTKP